jgi:hypothetical protein
MALAVLAGKQRLVDAMLRLLLLLLLVCSLCLIQVDLDVVVHVGVSRRRRVAEGARRRRHGAAMCAAERACRERAESSRVELVGGRDRCPSESTASPSVHANQLDDKLAARWSDGMHDTTPGAHLSRCRPARSELT